MYTFRYLIYASVNRKSIGATAEFSFFICLPAAAAAFTL
jgi:hypothetical protein